MIKKKPPFLEALFLRRIFVVRAPSKKDGAADQIRTDDLLHGKQTLYQLSYNRV